MSDRLHLSSRSGSDHDQHAFEEHLLLQDLEFVVQNQADKKHKISLLNKVSGVLYPGLMSALMGPSGSGKTSLLGRALSVPQKCIHCHFFPQFPGSSNRFDKSNSEPVIAAVKLFADCLAGRKTTGEVKGTILFAGRPASKSFLRRFTGYVEQFGEMLSLWLWWDCIERLKLVDPPSFESLDQDGVRNDSGGWRKQSNLLEPLQTRP